MTPSQARSRAAHPTNSDDLAARAAVLYAHDWTLVLIALDDRTETFMHQVADRLRTQLEVTA